MHDMSTVRTTRRDAEQQRPVQRIERSPSAVGREPGTANSVGRVRARARLKMELRSIAYDLLGPPESEELPVVCATWIEAAIADVVDAVCDSSLQQLTVALDRELSEAPLGIIDRLAGAASRRDAGIF